VYDEENGMKEVQKDKAGLTLGSQDEEFGFSQYSAGGL
jgi:hypothetical protein